MKENACLHGNEQPSWKDKKSLSDFSWELTELCTYYIFFRKLWWQRELEAEGMGGLGLKGNLLKICSNSACFYEKIKPPYKPNK